MLSDYADRFLCVVINMKNIADLHKFLDIVQRFDITASDQRFTNVMAAESNSCRNSCNIDGSVDRQDENTLDEIALRLCRV